MITNPMTVITAIYPSNDALKWLLKCCGWKYSKPDSIRMMIKDARNSIYHTQNNDIRIDDNYPLVYEVYESKYKDGMISRMIYINESQTWLHYHSKLIDSFDE